MALEVPRVQRLALGPYLEACRDVAPGYRWVEPENLHLTLRFLGYLGAPTLELLAAQLRSVDAPPFRIALDGRGTFGPRSSPRVVWVAVGDGAAACAGLATRVEAACQRVGLDPEPRPFRAHVTLARLRVPDGGAGPASASRGGNPPFPLPDLPPLQPWQASDFVLFESRPGRGGPTYAPLRRFRLG